jgi:hypothetical protein
MHPEINSFKQKQALGQSYKQEWRKEQGLGSVFIRLANLRKRNIETRERELKRQANSNNKRKRCKSKEIDGTIIAEETIIGVQPSSIIDDGESVELA